MTEIANIKQQLSTTYRNHLNPIYNSISLKQVDMVDEHVKVLIFGDNGATQLVTNKLMNVHNSRTYNNSMFNLFVPSERLLTLNYSSGAQFFPAFAAKVRRFIRPSLVEVSTYNASGVIGTEHERAPGVNGSMNGSGASDSDQNQFYSQISCILEAPQGEDDQKSPFLYILAPQITDFTPHDVLELLYNLINVVDRILVVLPPQTEVPQQIRDFLYICQQRDLQEKIVLCQQQQKLKVCDVRTRFFEMQIISQQIFQFCSKIMKIHPIVLEKPEMESFRSISFADGLREEPDTQFVQIDTFQQVIDLLGQAAETLVQQDIQYFLNDAQVVQKELHDFMKNTQIVTCYLREKINIALALMWIIFLTVFHIYLHLFKNQWLSDVLEQYNVPHKRLMVVSLILTVINIITQFIRIKRRPKMNRYEQLNDNFKKNVMIKAETLEEILYAGKSYLDD